MSHQTGIHANEQLLAFISRCKQPANSQSIRLVKIGIRNEELVLEEYKEPAGTWEDDYIRLVKRMVMDRQPCYLLFRLDTVDGTGTYQWVLISWAPENSPVREKMLYASTKATLKTQFGAGSISSDYFASDFDEIDFNSYSNWLRKKKTGGEMPLTREEQELLEVKKQEAKSSCISKSQNTLPGIQFPIDDEVISALFDMKNGDISYVQLSIDIEREEIKLNIKLTSEEFDITRIRSFIPDNNARYHLIVFPHTHEGQFFRSIIFVYSIPGNSCSVKQKMLYSSCKSALLNAITDESKIGIQIDKKLEVDNPRELTRDFFIEELHPRQNVERAKFEKPKGPQKRGGKRLIRSNGDDE